MLPPDRRDRKGCGGHTQATFNIGVDTGGTFTDAFVADDAGGNWTAKVPTTPHDLTVCFSDAIEACAQAVGLARHDLLRRTAVIRFSSTIATNTALTRSGPKLGLLVTAAGREELYGLAGTAAGAALAEFIEPDMITGIAEELSPDGEVLVSPSPDEVITAVRDLLERGARLLVVCLRHSAVNPAHEAAVGRIINASYPRHYLGAVPTLLSTDVSVIADDADRMAAAVVNGYLHRRLATSLYKAEDDLRAAGLARPLLIVTADGSVARVAKTRALDTYQSGPAAGVHGAALLARTYRLGSALTADVGGTSTDFGLVVAGQPVRRRASTSAGWRSRSRRSNCTRSRWAAARWSPSGTARSHRAGQRRGRARAGLLRPGRIRSDPDRRVAGPRLPGSGELPRRTAPAVPRPGRRGLDARGRRSAGLVGARKRPWPSRRRRCGRPPKASGRCWPARLSRPGSATCQRPASR